MQFFSILPPNELLGVNFLHPSKVRVIVTSHHHGADGTASMPGEGCRKLFVKLEQPPGNIQVDRFVDVLSVAF